MKRLCETAEVYRHTLSLWLRSLLHPFTLKHQLFMFGRTSSLNEVKFYLTNSLWTSHYVHTGNRLCKVHFTVYMNCFLNPARFLQWFHLLMCYYLISVLFRLRTWIVEGIKTHLITMVIMTFRAMLCFILEIAITLIGFILGFMVLFCFDRIFSYVSQVPLISSTGLTMVNIILPQ